MPAISQLNDDWTKITAAAGAAALRDDDAARGHRPRHHRLRPANARRRPGQRHGPGRGHVVIDAGGALVGRFSEVAPTVSQCPADQRHGIGRGRHRSASGATGEVRGQIGGGSQMADVDASDHPDAGRRRSSPPARRCPGRGPLALSAGPADRPGHGRPQRRERRRPDRLPPARGRLNEPELRAGDHELPGGSCRRSLRTASQSQSRSLGRPDHQPGPGTSGANHRRKLAEPGSDVPAAPEGQSDAQAHRHAGNGLLTHADRGQRPGRTWYSQRLTLSRA